MNWNFMGPAFISLSVMGGVALCFSVPGVKSTSGKPVDLVASVYTYNNSWDLREFTIDTAGAVVGKLYYDGSPIVIHPPFTLVERISKSKEGTNAQSP